MTKPKLTETQDIRLQAFTELSLEVQRLDYELHAAFRIIRNDKLPIRDYRITLNAMEKRNRVSLMLERSIRAQHQMYTNLYPDP